MALSPDLKHNVKIVCDALFGKQPARFTDTEIAAFGLPLTLPLAVVLKAATQKGILAWFFDGTTFLYYFDNNLFLKYNSRHPLCILPFTNATFESTQVNGLLQVQFGPQNAGVITPVRLIL